MERECILTGDGSHTIRIPPNLTYHSVHGAIAESMHVFIRSGFESAAQAHPDTVTVFEVGFGTGLNAWLTMFAAERLKCPVYYEAIEPFPLSLSEAVRLNYPEQLPGAEGREKFEQLHTAAWNGVKQITPFFSFCKRDVTLDAYTCTSRFDVIYFDPFDPVADPGSWTTGVFSKLASLLGKGNILVTYSSKGIVRRTMQTAGFSIEKLPGPVGKREIVRATKTG